MTPALEGLLRTEAVAFVLETTRITGVLIVAPLPWSDVPARARVAVALALGVVAHGWSGAPLEAMSSLPSLVLAGASEFAVGAAIGFVVRLAIAVAEIAASSLAPLIGFGVAQVFDPQTNSTQTVLTRLFRLFAILLAVISGMHHVLIGSLLASFRVLPAGSMANPALAAPALLSMSAEALTTGVRLAIPILAVLFMTQIALGFISRAAPAMQIFSVGFAITLTVGTTVLIVAAPDMAREILAEFSHVGTRIESVLIAMGAR